MTDVTVDLPIYNTPIVDGRGNISEVWWRFFSTLLTRTGGTEGVDIETIVQLIEEIFVDLQELSIGIGTVDGKAMQANDLGSYLSQLLDLLATAPVIDSARLDVIESSARILDELSGTLDAKVNQALAANAELARLLETDGGSAL